MSDKNHTIPAGEYKIIAIKSAGPGGQHVNKVATGIELRFDIKASSLSEKVKSQLLALKDRRLTQDGILVITATQHRSSNRNKKDAIEKLRTLIAEASRKKKKRKPTKPGSGIKKARLDAKSRRSELKKLRKKVVRP